MPRIPVVEIEHIGQVFHPTEVDRGGGIDQTLTGKEPVFSVGQFEVLPVIAFAPHTLDGEHVVFWLNRKGAVRPLPWEAGHLQELAADEVFLDEFEVWLQQRRLARSRHAWVYFNIGFLPRTEPVMRDGVMYASLQSQERLHVHIVDELQPNNSERWLEMENPATHAQWSRFLNVAGEASIARLRSPHLENFGRPITLQQNFDGTAYTRTAFAFPSLKEAYQAILRVQNALAEKWLDHARELATNGSTEFAGYFFTAVQSAVPNFVTILPGELDRQRFQVETLEPVWILPFSTLGPPEILTPGGVVIERRPKRESELHSPAQKHGADHPLDSQDVSGLAIR